MCALCSHMYIFFTAQNSVKENTEMVTVINEGSRGEKAFSQLFLVYSPLDPILKRVMRIYCVSKMKKVSLHIYFFSVSCPSKDSVLFW